MPSARRIGKVARFPEERLRMVTAAGRDPRAISADLYASGCRRWASGGAPKGLYVAAARRCVAEPVGSRITSRAGPRADSRVPKARPAAELRRRRGSGRAGSGGSLPGGSSPRPAASSRLWRRHDLIGVDEHPASWRAAFRVIFAGTPPVAWSGRPQTTTAMAGTSSADWRGTASMALFWPRPGRQVRPGSFWAELPCPLKAATVSAAGALDDVQAGRDVARPRGRVVGDAQQHPGVAGQEAPARHHNNRSLFLEISC
jgi:hypothetical protein